MIAGRYAAFMPGEWNFSVSFTPLVTASNVSVVKSSRQSIHIRRKRGAALRTEPRTRREARSELLPLLAGLGAELQTRGDRALHPKRLEDLERIASRYGPAFGRSDEPPAYELRDYLALALEVFAGLEGLRVLQSEGLGAVAHYLDRRQSELLESWKCDVLLDLHKPWLRRTGGWIGPWLPLSPNPAGRTSLLSAKTSGGTVHLHQDPRPRERGTEYRRRVSQWFTRDFGPFEGPSWFGFAEGLFAPYLSAGSLARFELGLAWWRNERVRTCGEGSKETRDGRRRGCGRAFLEPQRARIYCMKKCKLKIR